MLENVQVGTGLVYDPGRKWHGGRPESDQRPTTVIQVSRLYLYTQQGRFRKSDGSRVKARKWQEGDERVRILNDGESVLMQIRNEKLAVCRELRIIEWFRLPLAALENIRDIVNKCKEEGGW